MNVTKVLQINCEFFEKWNGTKACACLDTSASVNRTEKRKSKAEKMKKAPHCGAFLVHTACGILPSEEKKFSRYKRRNIYCILHHERQPSTGICYSPDDTANNAEYRHRRYANLATRLSSPIIALLWRGSYSRRVAKERKKHLE